MHLTRSALAEMAGVHAETIRYYEQRGLLPPPRRNASGYRTYNVSDVARLRFIKRAQELGFSLREIEELLTLEATPGAHSGLIRERALAKIAEIEAKIRDLGRMRDTLCRLVAACDGQAPIEHCPILHALHDDRETHHNPGNSNGNAHA
jgi:MerR family copper efflux transcriptional regulator